MMSTDDAHTLMEQVALWQLGRRPGFPAASLLDLCTANLVLKHAIGAPFARPYTDSELASVWLAATHQGMGQAMHSRGESAGIVVVTYPAPRPTD